ncbi:2-oxo-4-hydroxy-4-carboxy-5-ureidoimidazoline decarboxylase [Streptomyces sp. WMMB 322]|uniref:2-oxo-4-hydroxy-4-carboxy-5-ureidoimidazoline decarboxylase n=1 Tax=Streptomyces sp. WMMB 322 TaxID=1286821 RepID=UPI0026713F09|nr:2-oxo-4-hydroxy-4-carboxy-5-ureidoimidazoline decarboxylase [Streptomyces sp. WMMB 322]
MHTLGAPGSAPGPLSGGDPGRGPEGAPPAGAGPGQEDDPPAGAAPVPAWSGPVPAPLPMPLSRFNAAPDETAAAVLLRCCGSSRWAARIAAFRPYPEAGSLLAALDEASYDMTPADVAEALSSESPQLPPPADGPARPASGGGPRGHDRPGVLAAHTALRAAHAAYEKRFGHAFLMCLDEWGPDEQLGQALAAIRTRLGNDPEEERPVVAEELRRLARARLRRMVGGLP